MLVFNKVPAEMLPCIKKPIVVDHKRIDEPFLVETLEGTMSGKAGDHLMKGVQGELYVCDADIFAATYDELDQTEEHY